MCVSITKVLLGASAFIQRMPESMEVRGGMSNFELGCIKQD